MINFVPWKEYQKTLPRKRMGTGVIIFDHKGKILLLKPSYKDRWTIPGGVVEKDESPLSAAQREMREEIGLKVKIGYLMAVSYNRANDRSEENIQWWFYGGEVSETQKKEIKVDGEEITGYRFVTLEEANKLGNKNYLQLKVLLEKAIKTQMAVYLENWEEV